MSRTSKIALLLALPIVVLMLAACGGSKSTSATTATETTDTAAATDTTATETTETETTEATETETTGTEATETDTTGAPSGDESTIFAAAQKTGEAGSAHFSLSLSGSGLSSAAGVTTTPGLPEIPDSFVLTGEGAFDSAGKKAQLTFDLGELGAAIGATGDASVEVLVDGDTIYVKLPESDQLSPLTGGKPWLKLEATDTSGLSGQKVGGVDLGALGGLSKGDPTEALEFLRAAGNIEEIGTEDVRGVETTHYRATIDLKEGLDKLTAEQRAQLEGLSASGPTTIPVDVWIDGDGYARKILVELTEIPDTPGASVKLEAELYDFGTSVDVTPPPADEVTDLSELLSGLGSGVTPTIPNVTIPELTIPTQTG